MGKIGFGKIVGIVAVFCVATVVASQAQTFATLLSFDGTNGSNPALGGLIEGANGNFYGATYSGGNSNACTPEGCGTAFEITPDGGLSAVYSFVDGIGPDGALMQATNGNFYGTTQRGGSNDSGTVYVITPEGALTVLYNFCSRLNCADGAFPVGTLVQGLDGNLYGTTTVGGNKANNQCGIGCGTVFEITPEGELTTLYSFNGTDGAQPSAGLVQGSRGIFYGTTAQGGTGISPQVCGTVRCGTVFEIAPSGKFSTLYNFCSRANSDGLCLDGAVPVAALAQGANGNFYGTTVAGGAKSFNGCSLGCGTVFEITPAGKLTSLYSFCSQTDCADGFFPETALLQGTDGNFYGTTEVGGLFTCSYSDGCGTLFEITTRGQFSVLYTFCSEANCADGADPVAGLMQATNGDFYGTTFYGGNVSCQDGCGTLFSLSVGLGPFVEANPQFGSVGRIVGILGNDLTGTTSVTFNGTPATFTVVSSTLIKATVPSGATTGTIEVTTPTGTLSSNVAFQVR